tara:strand:+ start:110 stop:1018 length:909 start_codon:yes stop_codon:yes gene_type:complete
MAFGSTGAGSFGSDRTTTTRRPSGETCWEWTAGRSLDLELTAKMTIANGPFAPAKLDVEYTATLGAHSWKSCISDETKEDLLHGIETGELESGCKTVFYQSSKPLYSHGYTGWPAPDIDGLWDLAKSTPLKVIEDDVLVPTERVFNWRDLRIFTTGDTVLNTRFKMHFEHKCRNTECFPCPDDGTLQTYGSPPKGCKPNRDSKVITGSFTVLASNKNDPPFSNGFHQTGVGEPPKYISEDAGGPGPTGANFNLLGKAMLLGKEKQKMLNASQDLEDMEMCAEIPDMAGCIELFARKWLEETI